MTNVRMKRCFFSVIGRPYRLMAFRQILCWLLLSSFLFGAAHAQQLLPGDTPGRLLTESEIKNIDSHVWPDGVGLPEGRGSGAQGQKIYEQRCADCHGGRGEGGTALELVGDHESLATDFPDRGIAAMWPYAPTLFEYVRRAMPPQEPWSLSVDETYAVLAHLLELNGLLKAGTALDAATLAAIKLPNSNGFIDEFSSQ